MGLGRGFSGCIWALVVGFSGSALVLALISGFGKTKKTQ